jgi:hypothetical protein
MGQRLNALTLQRIAVTVKLTSTHLAAYAGDRDPWCRDG